MLDQVARCRAHHQPTESAAAARADDQQAGRGAASEGDQRGRDRIARHDLGAVLDVRIPRAGAERACLRIAHGSPEPGVAGRDRTRGACACRLMMGQDQLDVAQLRLREGDLCRPVGPG